MGVCELAGVVGGGSGAARSGALALPAIDTDTPVANGQSWPLFEDCSRFAGSSGGSSPMVCGCCRCLWWCMVKAAGVGLPAAFGALCALGFILWGLCVGALSN